MSQPDPRPSPEGAPHAGVIRHDVLPLALAFCALIGLTLLVDGALHLLGARALGRWLGIPGVLLIGVSFLYSARKRRLIQWGPPAGLLRAHELLAWAGSALILVHAGVHFGAALPWLAVVAMLANVGSGLTGKLLLRRARQRVEATRARLEAAGLSAAEIDAQLTWDAAAVDVVQRWRAVHFPVTAAFGLLALAHISAAVVFWGQP
ncbi:MAG: hypothetical protein JNM72_00415 [Deltaproteobacteria bacterium]|nr:hypothetical protein [Deltaproteobacteria bacterium]